MSTSRIARSIFGACTTLLLAACAGSGDQAREAVSPSGAPAATAGNTITGQGLPNPAPHVTRNWGQLPAGRQWGTTAGIDIDPKDGNIWAYERCGAGASGGAGGGPVDCETNLVDPVFKFDRANGAVLANFGKSVMVTPHGLSVDRDGNVWVADFSGNKAGTKGHQVHKFSPRGEKLMSLGLAGKPGNADGHNAQAMTTEEAIADGLKNGATSRISKFSPDGKFIKSWGKIGVKHGEFRTPHALMFDPQGRLWVADRGNHRLEIFDQDGNYLESRYQFSRVSGFFIKGDLLYAIDSESNPLIHANWRNGVRIGPWADDRVTAFIPPFEREDRNGQGAAGEGVAVDADGDVYAAEGPNSFVQAGGAFTKYSVK